MASPYGKTSGGSDQPATAGLTNEQVMDSLFNSFRPIPVKYTVDVISPVWLRTEPAHPCLVQSIPDIPAPLVGEYEEAPTSSQADDEDETPDDDRYKRLALAYPGLTRSELEAIEGEIVDVLDIDEDFRDEFLRDTQDMATSIREFLFKQIAPMAVGSSIAFDEFNQELSAVLGDKNATSNFSTVKQMLEDAMTMKTFEFLTEQLNLSSESSRNVLSVFMAKRISPGGKGRTTESLLKDLLNATKGA
ncbi:hypothetical protein Peetri_00001 [Pseudomonas phage vB_PpuM-Peetri]